MSHVTDGLMKVGESYALLAASGVLGVYGIGSLSSGDVFRGGLTLAFSLLAGSMGLAYRAYAQDLLSRSEGDFSPPDPILKETLLVGPVLHMIASSDMEARARQASSQAVVHNAPRPQI